MKGILVNALSRGPIMSIPHLGLSAVTGTTVRLGCRLLSVAYMSPPTQGVRSSPADYAMHTSSVRRTLALANHTLAFGGNSESGIDDDIPHGQAGTPLGSPSDANRCPDTRRVPPRRTKDQTDLH